MSTELSAPAAADVVRAPRHRAAELFGCSQPTVSRLIGRLAPTITTVLTDHADRLAAHALRSTVRIDGFLVPTGAATK